MLHFYVTHVTCMKIIVHVNYEAKLASKLRWLDNFKVLFLRVYGIRRSPDPHTRKKRTKANYDHHDRANLVYEDLRC